MDIDADRLLVLIEARPPIYNFYLKEHHNQGIVNQIWTEIVLELDVTDNLMYILLYNIMHCNYILEYPV